MSGKSIIGRKRKITTAEGDSETLAWLTEESEVQSKVDSPIDPWLVGVQENYVLTAAYVQQSLEGEPETETVRAASSAQTSSEISPPADAATFPENDALPVDVESDEGEDIIITDTTFDDGPLTEDVIRASGGDENDDSIDVNRTADVQVVDNVAGAPFGELQQTVVSDDTVLLTSTATFRAYVWGAYQLRVLHGAVTIHGARLTTARSDFVPVYALRVKSIPAIEAIDRDDSCTDGAADESDRCDGGVLSEEQLRQACGAGWQSAAARLREVQSNCRGWALLVRRLHSRLLQLLASKHGDTFTPAATAGDELLTATGCMLLRGLPHAEKAGATLHLTSPDCDRMLQELVAHTEPLRVVFAGGKGVGKSTLLYRTLNRLLLRHRHVYVLDCDPGQAEFTPCACLSLLRLDHFQLGPSFTHIQPTLRSIFTGEVSVANDPAGYMSAVQELSSTYWRLARHDPAPLLVNTMGWAKDLGEALLLEVLGLLQPTDVVEVRHPVKPQVNFAEPLDWERVNATPRSWLLAQFLSASAPRRVSVSHRHHCLSRPLTATRHANSETGLLPWMYRQLNTTAMVVALEQPDLPLCQLTPACIGWSSLAMRVGGEQLSQHVLLPQHVLHAMNGCVVALCRTDPACWLRPSDPSLFSLLPHAAPPPDCLAFGVVRGVDWQRRLLYLLTALPVKQLHSVNTLARGPHHLMDVFARESGMPIWAPSLTETAPLGRPNERRKMRRW